MEFRDDIKNTMQLKSVVLEQRMGNERPFM